MPETKHVWFVIVPFSLFRGIHSICDRRLNILCVCVPLFQHTLLCSNIQASRCDMLRRRPHQHLLLEQRLESKGVCATWQASAR